MGRAGWFLGVFGVAVGCASGSGTAAQGVEHPSVEPRTVDEGFGAGPLQLIISGTRVRVDGAVVASTTAHELRKVGDLYRYMKPLEKGQEPGYALRVLGDTDGASLKSVIQTMALAGFPNAKLEARDEWVDVKTQLPDTSARGPSQRLTLLVRSGGVELSQRQLVAGVLAEQPLGQLSPERLEAELPPLLVRHCAEPELCRPLLVHVGNDTRYALLERVLAVASDATRGRRGGEAAIELRVGPPPAHPGQPALPRSSLESPDVQGVVAAHHAEFAGCYEPAASLDPDLVGVVALEFGLNPDGRVGWVESTRHTDVFDSEVVDCVVSTFARLPFAAPENRSARGAFSFVFGLSSAER